MTLRSFTRRLGLVLPRMLRDTRAATAVEYGLIVALIVIAMVSALKSVADANTNMWSTVSAKVTAAG